MADKDLDAQQLEAAAIRLLATREHSRSELERKLAGKADKALIAEVLDGLAQQGLQSDERFTEIFTRSRLDKGQGPLIIRRDLRQLGIDSSLIDEAMAEAEPDWRAMMQRVAERKFGAEKPTDYKEATKRARFLAQRGFEPEAIRDFLDF